MTAQLLGYRSCLAEHLVPSGGDLIQGDEYKLMGEGANLNPRDEIKCSTAEGHIHHVPFSFLGLFLVSLYDIFLVWRVKKYHHFGVRIAWLLQLLNVDNWIDSVE